MQPEKRFGARRICYINFAAHLLNAYNPNMLYPSLPHRWSDAHWRSFIDMIASFGFNTFEFWLVPRLFSQEGLTSEYGLEFIRQGNMLIDHARTRGVEVEMALPLTTVGTDWRTYCPNVKEEWEEVRGLWDAWTKRLPGLGIVGIFPGDPGGCSRNGCTAETYIDKSVEVAGIIKKNIPDAEIEFHTWGPPIFGWGLIKAPADWQGEFVPEYMTNAWHFDKQRADRSMAHLVRRLPDFPAGTSVGINMGFNPDGNPEGEEDARPWAREIAKTHRILTWDFSLTEGENAICPHYRFDRLFAQRKEERAGAPYSGGICFTMTPLLNQLSLYESAQSFENPNGNPDAIAEEFFAKLFGADGRALAANMRHFEVVSDWGHYVKADLSREEYHGKMTELAAILDGLRGKASNDIAFHPSPEAYREELLFFATLFADLSGPSPDYDALRKLYWDRVYGIYDHLPEHVDPRPKSATDKLIRTFAQMGRD